MSIFNKLCMKKLKEYQIIQNKIIIFDFDGVLADTIKIKGDVFFSIFKNYGVKTQKYAKEIHFNNTGLQRKYKFIKILKFLKEKNIYKKLIDFNNLFEDEYKKQIKKIKINKNFEKFIVNNCKFFKFYISSAAPVKEINQILINNNLDKYFVSIFGSPIKKEVSIRKIIKNNLNIKNRNIIFIGDSMHDYDVAKKLNINFIAFKLNVKESNKIKYLSKSIKFKKIVYEYLNCS